MKNNRGITLVALIVTIIVLLILAGITISLVIGDNGILNKAQKSEEEYIKAAIKEEMELGILDIQAELSQKNPPESLTKEAILDKLADRLNNTFTITDVLDGEYKGYHYYIDDQYVVHIGEKANGIMNLNVKVEKIGTSYFTISAVAQSTQGNIVGYTYIIDGVEKTQTINTTYTEENLEEKTSHTVKIIAIDEKGNKKESRTLKITTEEKVYLYKNGQEVLGTFKIWKQNGASLSIIRSTEEIGFDSVCTNISNTYRGMYINFDLTNNPYTKLYVDISSLNNNIEVGFGKTVTNTGGNYIIPENHIATTIPGVYEIDISTLKKDTNFFIQAGGKNTTNIRSTKAWLEY